MKILITGGAGFLGTRLALALLKRGTLNGKEIHTLVLSDLLPASHPALLNDARVRCDIGDLLDRCADLMAIDYDVVFHLAAGEAVEGDDGFEADLRSHLKITSNLLEALRLQQGRTGHAPTFLFASSLAVYGSDAALPLPPVVRDDTLPTPQSSFGIHKFICEQLVAEYTRRRFIDGRAARLMTVSVRPGKPKGAISDFLSAIVREPLAGISAICPVDPTTEVAISSPDATIEGMLKVVEASRNDFGGRTALNLPALTVTVAQMLEALGRATSPETVAYVRLAPQVSIARIVGSWPSRFESARAQRLGLQADASFDDVIAQFRLASLHGS